MPKVKKATHRAKVTITLDIALRPGHSRDKDVCANINDILEILTQHVNGFGDFIKGSTVDLTTDRAHPENYNECGVCAGTVDWVVEPVKKS